MHMLILAVFILAQIILNIFLIGSLVALNDQLEVFGIPIHLIMIFLLNIASLLLLAKLYMNEEKRMIQFTESTHEEQFRALVASVRSDRHDLNNHLTVIAGLIKINNYTSAANYIDEIIGEVKINNKALLIQNAVLASILFTKMELYQKQQIPFVTNIESEGITSKLSSTDLIRLISNLLDNAYDATMEVAKEFQKVVIELSENKHYYTIIVKNSSKHESLPEQLLEEGRTTKTTDKRARGFGLSIIQEVTKKYGGTIDIQNENSLIVFHLSFPKGEN